MKTTASTHPILDAYTVTVLSKWHTVDDKRPQLHFQLEIRKEGNPAPMHVAYHGGIGAFCNLSKVAARQFGAVKKALTDHRMDWTHPANRDTVRQALNVVLDASAPSKESVFHSLSMDAQGIDQPFPDWAADLGYNPDSIKDREVYEACVRQTREYRALVGKDFDAIAEALQDY